MEKLLKSEILSFEDQKQYEGHKDKILNYKHIKIWAQTAYLLYLLGKK